MRGALVGSELRSQLRQARAALCLELSPSHPTKRFVLFKFQPTHRNIEGTIASMTDGRLASKVEGTALMRMARILQSGSRKAPEREPCGGSKSEKEETRGWSAVMRASLVRQQGGTGAGEDRRVLACLG